MEIQKITLRALRPITHNDPCYLSWSAKEGQIFEAPMKHAAMYLRRGTAELYIPPLPQAPPATYETKVIVSAPPAYTVKTIEPGVQLGRTKRSRGRPSIPTSCPKCGEMCAGKRDARRHCRKE